jgi:preprotein translocase subunit YajC
MDAGLITAILGIVALLAIITFQQIRQDERIDALEEKMRQTIEEKDSLNHTGGRNHETDILP